MKQNRKLNARKVLVIGAAAAWCAMFVLTPASAHASNAPHYTDGSQCDGGGFCGLPSAPPPLAPTFSEPCMTAIVDPPLGTFTFITLHFVYGTTAPAAGVVPVTDDASQVTPYKGNPPNVFPVDVSQNVEGERGFLALTWNIGKGVTAWVPFDCTPPASTTTTTTTVPPSTTTTTTIVTPPVPATPAPPVVTQPQFTG